ncbi:hypothetical protein [Delftia phage PhiW-14]|uniref:Uncharacterized protein n=1 Tax=Delftia phage PhiW-14 TaxID=665032 RepID=C9DG94_BPW14|nr:hypothetical protein DP-phiW-14_gp124 [Delftia phage PhiW-14]ACV50145.1 hypothetical protein [Delftia phage PhiW-14]
MTDEEDDHLIRLNRPPLVQFPAQGMKVTLASGGPCMIIMGVTEDGVCDVWWDDAEGKVQKYKWGSYMLTPWPIPAGFNR